MRIFYLFLDLLLKITLWIYYPRYKVVNAPKKRMTRTIFMSNHAGSFMDPLIIASMQKPIVFFMTRSDVFTFWLKPVLWGAHMLPIYREHDGKDTKKKNEEVFKKCARVLSFGRSLIVFAEGYTDNVFIRRLKPVKKGSVRIGFTALESMNWKKRIYLQGVGVNYSDRNVLGSGCVVSYSTSVCLNDYKEQYEENPGKTIHMLTKKMEGLMQDQITDVRNEKMAPFHENVMRITRKGMNAKDSNKEISLLERRKYSQQLARWFNQQEIENNQPLMQLKERLERYFTTLKKEEIDETVFYKLRTNRQNKFLDRLYIVLLFPIAFWGHIHTYIPVRLIKKFVENTFRRSVFWASVKMLVGFCAVGIFNILLFLLLSSLFSISFWGLFVTGIFIIPLLFAVTREWQKTVQQYRAMNKIEQKDYSALAKERMELEEEIKRLIPVA